ncbi:MAG: hypothetical protein K9G58_07485 [Bacteroidales bacterium]|nr:hypothetical protein [Bacteroidales bacterium]MCF8397991.1 hypothetical protein [Bacteroidales bacterium]
MKFKFKVTVFLFYIFSVSGFAQHKPFSNEVVISKAGNEMMPYVKGEVVLEDFHNDARSLSLFSKPHIDEFRERIDQLTSIISSWDKLNPPQGFKVIFGKSVNTWEYSNEFKLLTDDSWSVTAASVELYFHPYFKGVDGNPFINRKISSAAYIYFNNPFVLAGAPLIEDIYPGPRKAADFHGFPVFRTNRQEVTIISKKSIPLFIPVSQEDYLHTLIANLERRIENDRQFQDEPENKQNMKMLAAGKAERQAEMEKAYQELFKYDKNAAENLKKNFFEIEEMILAESMGNDGEVSGEAAAGGSITFMQEIIHELESELASLSPEERQRQAFYDVNAMEDFNNQSGLVPNGNLTNSDPLVRINKGLVDPANPNLQLIAIRWFVGTRADIPRLYNEGKDGHLLADFNMAELYKQNSIWKQISGMLF